MILWLLFLFLLPLQEGSATPAGLLTAQLALLAAIAATGSRLSPLRRSLALPALGVLAVAAASGAMGEYRFASLLATLDLAAILAALVLGEALARARPSFAGTASVTVAGAGLVQALLILGAWIAGGFRARIPGTLLNPDHAAAYLVLAFWALIAAGRSGTAEAPAGQTEGGNPGKAGGGASTAVRPLAWPLRAGAAAAGRPRIAAVAGALLLAAAILQASRGALVGLLAGGGLFLALRLRAMTRRTRLGVAAAALLLALAATAVLAHRFTTQDDPYRWERLRLWGVALRVGAEHPVLGVGPGLFGHVSGPFDLARADWPVRYAKHVEATHSDYLRVAAETGLLGVLAFGVLLLAVAAGAARAIRRGGAAEAALGAALAGLLAQCLFENLSTRPAVACTGALLAGLLLARAEGGDGQPAPARERGLMRRARAILLYGALLWAALVLVIAPYLADRSFRLFRAGGADVGARYASAVFWNPIQPEYRAALAEAVLAARSPRPADLRAGFLAVDEAIALKPVEPRYLVLRARLARAAFRAGGGQADWIRMAAEAYDRASALSPLRPQAMVESGWMFLMVGRPEPALRSSERAIGLEPSFFEARRLRAAALLDLGRGGDARREIEEAARRHAEVSGIVPSDPYESEILAWNAEEWAALEDRPGS